jgi:site-specific DNA-methyltransferase (adenine-specific)
LNVEKCRIQTNDSLDGGAYCKSSKKDMSNRRTITLAATGKVFEQPIGRFPSNLIHDGSAEVLALFPETTSVELNPDHKQTTGWFSKDREGAILRNYGGDSGSAARFFYCAKASKTERGKGNIHTTVKPVQLMNYLVTLITPPDGIVLDPFTGSGSTLVAAKAKGFKYIGVEREPEYHTIAEKRVQETDVEKDCLEELNSLSSLEETASEIPASPVVDVLDLLSGLDE